MLTWFSLIDVIISHFSFFLGTVINILRLYSGTDLIACELKLHSWVSQTICFVGALIDSSDHSFETLDFNYAALDYQLSELQLTA